MGFRHLLSLSLLVVGLSSAGCASGSGRLESPTAPSSDGNASSSAGATRAPQPPHQPPPSTGTCVADKAKWAVGQPVSAAVLERARVDATAAIVRVIRPDEAITMEFSPARLNLYLDERDVIRSVICG